MKANGRILGVALCFSLCGVFTACDSPIGLGSKVNTSVPKIQVPEPPAGPSKPGGPVQPGGYLSGNENTILLDITQDQGFPITEAVMEIEYYDKSGKLKTAKVPGEYDKENKIWKFNIDTHKLDMDEGKITTRVTATDSSGKSTTTTDIIYFVKNLPPQIEMTIPSIKGRDFDSIDRDLNEFLVKYDQIFVGIDLMGLATDNLGLEEGYPKIMFWPVLDGLEMNEKGEPIDKKWGQWYSADVQNPRPGITATRFTWPMSELIEDPDDPAAEDNGWRLPRGSSEKRPLPSGYYRFKMWVRDTNGVDNFYPLRTDNERGPGGTPAVPNDNPSKYIEINYVNPEIPIVTFVDVPGYFNGEGYISNVPGNPFVRGPFSVEVFISHQNDLDMTRTKAWITDSSNSSQITFKSDEYDLVNISTEDTPDLFKLTITSEQAAAWYTQANPLKSEEVTLFVNILAVDVNDNTSPSGLSWRTFNFDKKPAEVLIDRPVTVPTPFASGSLPGGHYKIYYPLLEDSMPRWVTGRITIGGTTQDTFGIKGIYYHVGNLNDDDPSADRESIYNNVKWIDPGLQKASSYIDSDGGVFSGSLYSWNYTYDFNDWGRHKDCELPCASLLHDKVQDLIQESWGLIGDFSGVNYNTTTIDPNTGKKIARFYLPFYVKVVDIAGNFHVVQYKLCIDPDLDIPYVSISTPSSEDGKEIIIGGEVNLSGLATDNDWIHSVQIRIKKYGTGLEYTLDDNDGKGTYKYYRPFRPNTTNDPSNLIPLVYETTPNFPRPDGELNTPEAKAGWFNAVKRNNDMVIGWYFNINTYGGLDPEGSEKTVDIRIEVRAVDSKDRGLTPSKVGASTVMDVKFSSGVPTISQPVINKETPLEKPYYEGITASGRFNVSMTIGDDGRLQNIRTIINGIRYDLLTNQNVINNTTNTNAGLSITEPAKNHDRDESVLTINIDTITNTLYNEYGFGRTGTISIEVEAHDDSDPTFITRSRYTIGIDNYYPTTSIDTTRNASSSGTSTPPKNFELSGIASDSGESSGSIQDLARVLIYFEDINLNNSGGVIRTGIYRNPRGKINHSDGGEFPAQTGEADAQYSEDVYKNTANYDISGKWDDKPLMETYSNVRRDGQTVIGSGAWGSPFYNFPLLRQVDKSSKNAGLVWESPHAMVIDSHELSEDLDTDGTLGEAWSGLVEKTWRAWMDTEAFNDGPLMVHYIVMDQAGNATHYMKDIFIENNKPEIVSINLGTNIRGTDTLAPWQSSSDPGDYMRFHYPIENNIAGNTIITFSDVLDNPFRIRGDRLTLRLETSKGNGVKHYRVSYVTPMPRIQAVQMQRGHVYTIETSGTTDWQRYGAPNNTVQTTFVASGPGEGNGWVVHYTEVTHVTGLIDKNADPDANDILDNQMMFDDTDFGDEPGKIPDSTKNNGIISRPPLASRPGTWPGTWPLSMPERLFIIKVYDSTVSGMDESFQLAHAVLVALDIDNTDQRAPTIDVAPFGQKYVLRTTPGTRTPNIDNNDDRVLGSVGNYNDNIVMSGDARQGYVQYAAHSNTGNADISGQVIFTGKASDNQRIQNITVTIPGYNGGSGSGEPFTVATWSGSGLIPSVGRTGMGSQISDMWYFKVLDQSLSLDYGHTINWEFAWDSSYVTNQVGSPAGGVVFTVNDFRSSGGAVDSSLPVNIVPYISEITTGLSGMYGAAPSAFARSSTGWYPVRESETVIIKGFNLGAAGGTSATISATVNIGGTVTGNTAPSGGTNITPTAVSEGGQYDRNAIQLNVGTAAMSGELTVRVSGIFNSINNRTRLLNVGVTDNNANRRNTANRVAYNWEPNSVNNNMLTNGRKLYTWSAGNIQSGGHDNNASALEYPFMRVSSTGYRLLAYNSGTGQLYRSINDTQVLMENSTNRYLNVTASIGNNDLWHIGTSNQTAQADNSYAIHARAASSGAANADGSNKIRILNLGTSTAVLNPNRVRLPKVHARDTSTTASRVVTSYYDENSNQINFHYGIIAGTQVSNASTINLNAITRSGDFTNQHPTPQVVTASSNDHDGSMYTAVATLSNGVPVIAWYSPKSDSLLFSYGNAPATPTTRTVTGNGQEFVYTFANHDLTPGTAHENRVLVRNTTNNNAGTVYYVTRAYGSKFALNATSGAQTGADLGATINLIRRPYIGAATASAQTTNGATNTRWYRVNDISTLAVGNSVVLYYNNATYNATYVIRLLGNDTGNNNANNVKFATSATTTTASAYFAENLTATTNPNLLVFLTNPATNTITGAVRSQERYYTLANHGLTVSQQIIVNNTTYTVAEIWGNNFKLSDLSGNIVDLGATNISFATSSINVTTPTATWQTNIAEVAKGVGSYVDMAVDGADNVHLAYYDSNNGGLHYAYIPFNSSTGLPNKGSIEKAKVDTFLGAGTNIMINTRLEGGGHRPYISYIHSSYATTRGAIRIAWPITAVTGTKYAVENNTDSSDLFLGTWEVMTVPIVNPPITPLYSTFVVTNGVPTSVTNWVKPAGINWPLSNTANTIEKSVVIGFMAGSRYEGAVLKTDITALQY